MDDLPRWLAAVHPRHRTPHHAELALAVVALVATLPIGSVVTGVAVLGVGVAYRLLRTGGRRSRAGRARTPER